MSGSAAGMVFARPVLQGETRRHGTEVVGNDCRHRAQAHDGK